MLSKFCFIRVAKSTKIIGGQRLCSQPNIAHAQSPEPVSKGPRFLKWMGKGVTLLIGGIYVYFVVGSYVATISYTKERRYLTDEEVETYRTIARNMREKFPEFSDGELRSTCEEHFLRQRDLWCANEKKAPARKCASGSTRNAPLKRGVLHCWRLRCRWWIAGTRWRWWVITSCAGQRRWWKIRRLDWCGNGDKWKINQPRTPPPAVERILCLYHFSSIFFCQR